MVVVVVRGRHMECDGDRWEYSLKWCGWESSINHEGYSCALYLLALLVLASLAVKSQPGNACKCKPLSAQKQSYPTACDARAHDGTLFAC